MAQLRKTPSTFTHDRKTTCLFVTCLVDNNHLLRWDKEVDIEFAVSDLEKGTSQHRNQKRIEGIIMWQRQTLGYSKSGVGRNCVAA